MAQISNARGYSAGRFMLEIEKQMMGYLSVVEGGEAFAAVVTEPVSGNQIVRKHPGPVHFEPIRISFGADMEAPLYQWIADMLKGNAPAKSGAIVFLDHNLNAQARLEFDRGRITEIVFPAMDAASKDAAHFTLVVQPEVTRFNKGSPGAKGVTIENKAKKPWTLSNFRLTIDDLLTTKVNTIDAITVKQAVSADQHVPTLQPLDISNIAFTLPESDAQPVFDWFDDFIMKGNSSKERNGTLEFLDASMTGALFNLTISKPRSFSRP